jgi:hypothetical protein
MSKQPAIKHGATRHPASSQYKPMRNVVGTLSIVLEDDGAIVLDGMNSGEVDPHTLGLALADLGVSLMKGEGITSLDVPDSPPVITYPNSRFYPHCPVCGAINGTHHAPACSHNTEGAS